MWGDLIDFFVPKKCVICGELEVDLCCGCEREFGLASQICPMCEEDSVMGWTHRICIKKLGMDGLICLFEYGDPGVRKMVDAIKYGFNRELVDRVLRGMALETGVSFDYIVPIPLYFYRHNWRGFNQAELIAIEVQKQIGGEVKNLLVRHKNTKQQALMKSREERIENIKGAFSIKNQKHKNSKTLNVEDLDLKRKRVLLVDDVFTTGNSMKECSKVLKKFGVEVIWGFVLAH